MYKCLVLSLCVLSASAHAAVPSDEDTIENEIDLEDKQTAPLPKPDADALTPDPAPAPPTPASAPKPQLSEAPIQPETEEPPVAPTKEPEYNGTERATSSGRGEPEFDWSKHRGETEVPHPFAEKGLLRVTKDRTYIYRVEDIKPSRAVTVKVGIFNPVNLINPDEKGQPGSTFADNYPQTSPALMVDYEWHLWPTNIGKFGVKLGSGLFIAQGHGHFVGSVDSALTPLAVFSFFTVPVNLGGIWRMNVTDRQLFVPYVEGGGTAFAFTETRDDNKGPKFGGALGGYAAAGLAFNLTYFDALTRIQLNREYGISAIYLTAEFRQLVSFTRYNFTSALVNGGFVMEF